MIDFTALVFLFYILFIIDHLKLYCCSVGTTALSPVLDVVIYIYWKWQFTFCCVVAFPSQFILARSLLAPLFLSLTKTVLFIWKRILVEFCFNVTNVL